MEGHKVKASVVFKGREITYKERGEEMLTKLTEKIGDIAKVDQEPHMEGRSMVTIYTPDIKKKKAEHKHTTTAGVPNAKDEIKE
jgi:translation initiation factor IF-3